MAELHERDIVFKNGLVDPTSLFEYMDDCHCADLIQTKPASGHVEEYHHLVFKRDDFKGLRVSLIFRRLRNSKYNQIEMLSCQEDLYHQLSAETVSKSQIDLDAARGFLEEDEILTDYATTSWLRARTEASLESESTLTQTERARLAGWLVLLDEMQSEATQKVQRIEFMAPEIVTGALMKYVSQQPEPRMQALVNARMNESGVFIPTKIYDSNALRDSAENNLRQRINEENWVTQRILAFPAVRAA